MTGQAAAFLGRSRTQWQKFAEENEIAQVNTTQNDHRPAHSLLENMFTTQCTESMFHSSHTNLLALLCVQLHKEMQESLGQLRAIQNELRYGPQLTNPG